MQYQITINIDDAGLKKIYQAQQYVTLVKNVIANPLSSGNLPIAWLSFAPLETNQITWTENYYMYASTTELTAGATISMTSQSQTEVQQGWVYTFAQGQFNGSPAAGSTFNVANQTATGEFTFGLAQQATLNNVSTLAPLNAQPVLFNETATFTPTETISVFLSSLADNGVILSQVASNALGLTLTSQDPSANVGFNDSSNTFFQQSSEAVMSAEDYALRRRAHRSLNAR